MGAQLALRICERATFTGAKPARHTVPSLALHHARGRRSCRAARRYEGFARTSNLLDREAWIITSERASASPAAQGVAEGVAEGAVLGEIEPRIAERRRRRSGLRPTGRSDARTPRLDASPGSAAWYPGSDFVAPSTPRKGGKALALEYMIHIPRELNQKLSMSRSRTIKHR